MYAGILIGYFGKQDEARKAFRQLRGRGTDVPHGRAKARWRCPYRGSLSVAPGFGACGLHPFGALASFAAIRMAWSGRGGFPGMPGLAWMRRSGSGRRDSLRITHAGWSPARAF